MENIESKKFYRDILWDGAQQIGVCLDSIQLNMFEAYLEHLQEWNQKINLTSITEEVDIIIKHFIDSLSPLPYLPLRGSLLDIGSGGGFPGIPLKIAGSSLKINLMDSSQKKIFFQKHIIGVLELQNITAIHQRGEDLPAMLGEKNKYHESGFDVVIARALTAFDKFLRMGKPLLNKGGTLVAMKGKGVKREIKNNYDLFESLNLKIERIVHITLPYLKTERNLIFIKNNLS